MTTVRLEHLRAMRLCTRGVRHWCARYQISWETVRGPGVPIEQVEATGDPMALRVVEYVRGLDP